MRLILQYLERFHSTLIEHLRILIQKDKEKSVIELMPYVIIAYNSSIHSVTKYTPHELVFGHTNSRDPLDLISSTFYSDYVTSHKDKVNAVCDNVVNDTDKCKQRVLAKTNVDISTLIRDFLSINQKYDRLKAKSR